MENNKYQISEEILNKALFNMIEGGYIPKNYTTNDLISFAESATENIPFMVIKKINKWAIA